MSLSKFQKAKYLVTRYWRNQKEEADNLSTIAITHFDHDYQMKIGNFEKKLKTHFFVKLLQSKYPNTASENCKTVSKTVLYLFQNSTNHIFQIYITKITT